MSDTKNVKLGPCVVTFDGNDLGLTKGGVEVDVTTETHPVTVDQFGETVISEFITKRNVKVVCPLAETTVDNLISTMPGTELVQGGGEYATAVVQLSTGGAVITDIDTHLESYVSALEVNGVPLVFVPSNVHPNEWQIQKSDTFAGLIDNIAEAINERSNSAKVNLFEVTDKNGVTKEITLSSKRQTVEHNGVVKVGIGKRSNGKIVFNTLPTAASSLTLNGVEFKFVTSLSGNNQVQQVKIDASGATTADKIKNTVDNLIGTISKLINRYIDAPDGTDKKRKADALNKAYYSRTSGNDGLQIYHKTLGVDGNAYTIKFEQTDGNDGVGANPPPASSFVTITAGTNVAGTGNYQYKTISSTLTGGKDLANSGTDHTSKATFDGGSNPTFTGASVKSAIGVNLLDTARKLVLRPVDNAEKNDASEDFIIPLAATSGALKFAYKHNEERVFNVEFMGYPDPTTKLLFKLGDVVG